MYKYIKESANQTNLRLLNVETVCVYLKVSVVKKIHHLISFYIALINFILKPSAK